MPRPQATVHRLRPRNRRQVELLQELLSFGGLSEPTRIELNQLLSRRLPEAGEPWSFAMVTASQETVAAFLQAVRKGPRAYATLAVWNALAPFVRRDTGEVLCTQRTLAKTAALSQGDVQRGLGRLVEMGVLLRDGRGVYRVHPSVMWKGELVKRERAAAVMPKLELVREGRETE
jgi:Firmicute plasmid replication protein (RepL)